MTESSKCWLGISAHFTDNKILHQLDPYHVKICVAETAFCQDLIGFRRGLCSNNYNRSDQYIMDRINVFFVNDATLTTVLREDDNSQRTIVTYTKSHDDERKHYIDTDKIACVFFQEKTKECLGYVCRPEDNIMQQDVTDFSSYFFEETAGDISTQDISAWGYRKRFMKQNSLNQLRYVLHDKEYGQTLINKITAYNRQTIFNFN